MRSTDQRLQRAQNAQATRQEDLQKGRILIERKDDRPAPDQQRAISCDEATRVLGLPPRSLYDPRRRQRLGLPAVRLGRRLMFVEADVLALIERGRERLDERGER